MNNLLKEKRLEKNMTLEQVGNLVGVGKSTVRKWENGMIENMGRDKIVALSKALDISPLDILGLEKDSSVMSIESIYSQLIPMRQQKVYEYAERQLEEQNNKVVPLLGGVAANPAELAYGDIAAEDVVEYNVPEKADCALVVHGDSMEPDYHDGDIVFYKCQITIENGETAVVEINGDGVTLKKVYFNFDEDKVILRSLNGKYEDRELNPEEVRVLGKVVK
ncbi:DNA-binding helix-turn-helix protein [Enterococcus faecalis 06-MB-DW-09]|nr:DNA-binding helix-turn-helix protein [Enterococcus faecalis 06-MB-DW-09]